MSPARLSLGAALLLVLLAGLGAPAAAQPTPLEDYVRLRQWLAANPAVPERAERERQAAAAREALVAAAARESVILVVLERQRSWDAPGEQALARVASRLGRVIVEALGPARAQSPAWERAGELDFVAYRDFILSLLDDPALLADFPAQRLDPNAPGPRVVATVRLVIKGEERTQQALYGEPYERLAGLAASVIEFCRTVPLAAPAPPPEDKGGERI